MADIDGDIPDFTVHFAPSAPVLQPFISSFYQIGIGGHPLDDQLLPEWFNLRLPLSGEWWASYPGQALFTLSGPQQIGGWPKKEVMRLQKQGAALLPVTIDPGSRINFRQLLKGDKPVPLDTPGLPEGWTNFYRSDDVASVAYFYLDRPENGLPRLAPAAARIAGIRKPEEKKTPEPVQAYTPPD